jgi:hypothetical protein
MHRTEARRFVTVQKGRDHPSSIASATAYAHEGRTRKLVEEVFACDRDIVGAWVVDDMNAGRPHGRVHSCTGVPLSLAFI